MQQTNPALDFVMQSLNDFANTLPLSARGAFVAHANAAISDIKAAMEPKVTTDGVDQAH
jgi:hypothetical protein